MKIAQRIVVAGASLAGVRAMEALRREGYGGEIVALSAEKDMPYDRPPLSKQFLAGKFDENQISLRRDGFDDLDVEWRLGVRATALDPAQRLVALSDGGSIEYGGLLIATGSTARSLPFGADLGGVHLLRSLDDARALKTDLAKARRLVVIGAGFIGMEVAASARGLGLEVAVVESLPTPLLRGLGQPLGEVVSRRFEDHGVSLHCGVGVEALVGEGHVTGVTLSDGRQLPADVVVVGIGAAPACDWLAGSGLEINQGVQCDATGATDLPDVVAAGDVACWLDPRRGEPVRHEHWTSAVEQSAVAARRLLAGTGPVEDLEAIAYVWSDLFELRLAMVGEPAAGDEMKVVDGELDGERFLVLLGREGRFVGAVGLKRPRQVNVCRNLLGQGASWADAVAEFS
ncbi:MAG: FAD-dependent oxidoreductase [Myxococcota bacterium]|nr:FAD-dependent oxidoreductase [Myxococcota bacterium]